MQLSFPAITDASSRRLVPFAIALLAGSLSGLGSVLSSEAFDYTTGSTLGGGIGGTGWRSGGPWSAPANHTVETPNLAYPAAYAGFANAGGRLTLAGSASVLRRPR
ncbi:MAG: hypothetical protein ACFE0O_12620 [Opitutales bacterium]